ncbi:MAG: hypothetical protein ACMUIG_08515 [Thermoplasmatota archaeon]
MAVEDEIVLNDLFRYIKSEDFKGYDPYDCLNSRLIDSISSRLVKIAFTQLLVYSPLNPRGILGISKQHNPKGLALILQSLVRLKLKGFKLEGMEGSIDKLYDLLMGYANHDYSGLCWGYNFPWQDYSKYIPRFQPSIVVSSFAGHSLLDYHRLNPGRDIEKDVTSICQFILKDLNRYQDNDGFCFSYSPFDNTMTHNANMLGASLLLRTGRTFQRDYLIEAAVKAYDFSVKKQNPDGSWYYSYQPNNGNSRYIGNQIDYHQGFIIDTLLILNDEVRGSDLMSIIEKAVLFYEKQFNQDGRSYFRYPRKWPTDVHSQAQGIITFSKLSRFSDYYLIKAGKILDWTKGNMLSKDGHFHYHKWPMMKNRISYIRWGQAWMLSAITEFLIRGKKLSE